MWTKIGQCPIVYQNFIKKTGSKIFFNQKKRNKRKREEKCSQLLTNNMDGNEDLYKNNN